MAASSAVPPIELATATAGAASPADEKILLRVYFVDNSHKTLFVDPDTTTVEDLWRQLCEKLHMPQSDWENFFIFGISSELELLMYSDSTVSELILKWPTLRKQFSRSRRSSPALALLPSPHHRRSTSKIETDKAATFQRLPEHTHSTGTGTPLTASAPSLESLALSPRGPATQQSPPPRATLTAYDGPMLTPRGTVSTHKAQQSQSQSAQEEPDFKLVMKPTSVLPIEMEMAATSAEAVHLFYLQAVHDTVFSNYPTPKKLAVKLAALQLHVTAGDHNPALHKAGYLQLQIAEYVPDYLLKKSNPLWWEASILEAHKALAGKTREQAKLEYLQVVRGWKCYGSSFFKARYIPAHQSFFRQPFQGDVVLGINRLGVHVVDSKLMKKTSKPVVVVCPFDRIVWWDSDKYTFFFEFMPSPDSSASVLLTFKTPQGGLINDLLHDWMGEIENSAYERAQREMAAIAAAAPSSAALASSTSSAPAAAPSSAALASSTSSAPAAAPVSSASAPAKSPSGTVLTGNSILAALGQLNESASSSAQQQQQQPPATSPVSGQAMFPDPPMQQSPQVAAGGGGEGTSHHHHHHKSSHHHSMATAPLAPV